MKHVIAVDLGATKILAGILDEDLNVIHSETRPARDALAGMADPDLLRTKALIKDLQDFAASRNLELIAGGIGFPEYVDNAGTLTSADGVDWKQQPKNELAELTGLPWIVKSDVACAAVGEAALGAGMGLDNFLYITVSSGISHSFVINGAPWTGATGRAIGLGVTVIENNGTLKTLEGIASGLGIARAYAELSGNQIDSAIEVFQSESTDLIAAQVIARATEVLARGIVNIAEVLDPKVIIIGGGLWLGADSYRLNVLSQIDEPIRKRISLAKLNQPGLIGVGRAALDL